MTDAIPSPASIPGTGSLDIEAIASRYFAAWEQRDVDAKSSDGLVQRRDTCPGSGL